MNQLIFTDEAYKKFVKGIVDNLNRYKRRQPWLTDRPVNEKHFVKSTIIVQKKPKLLLPSGDLKYDFENAVEIHRCYQLTPLQASDPRLWTRLVHVEAWDYMQLRWQVTEDKETKYVRARYFVAGTDSRALLRNGIARLWWSAEITKNSKYQNDPYKLTRIMFSKLDIAQQLLEHSYGRSRPLVQGALRFIEKNADECLHDGQNSRNRVRHLGKQLFRRSGVTILDAMPESNLHEFLGEELERFNRTLAG